MKAVGLLSGGLDSRLALRLIKDQGVELTALNFSSVFCTCTPKTAGCAASAAAARELGIEVVTRNSTARMLSLLRYPPHGHGSCLNPCIDCRIGMFREAVSFMREIGASFIVTGEVLGERPMSQRRAAMELIDRESGAGDIVVRPLSAALMPPTLPEREGWVDRSLMLAIEGRSRKPQIALAKELGIEDYPCPAGGCRLTDPGFAGKLLDLLLHTPEDSPAIPDVNLLRVGRHFRLGPLTKLVVGRDEAENGKLASFARRDDAVLEPEEPGPLAILRGDHSDAAALTAYRIVARYAAPSSPETAVIETRDGARRTVRVPPLADDVLDSLRISPLKPGWRERVARPILPARAQARHS